MSVLAPERSVGVAARATTRVTLGYVPLNDAAPLILARALGYFVRDGLDVTLSAEPSWANIRDKLAVGAIDGAHMLASLPMAMSLGLTGLRRSIVTGLELSSGGNAITLGEPLLERMAAPTAGALADAIRAGGTIPRLAMTFPSGTHHYELRHWLAAGGVDPDRDVELVTIPPPRMVAALESGIIDGFCVGEPWNALAAERGIGRVVSTKGATHLDLPEKVLGVTEDWAVANQAAHRALVKSLVDVKRWLDQPGHRHDAAKVMADHLDAPLAVIERTLGDPSIHGFGGRAPDPEGLAWYGREMIRWGHLPADAAVAAAARALIRDDLVPSAEFRA